MWLFCSLLFYDWSSLVAQLVKNPPAMQETPVLFPGLGRSPGEGIGYPLQYSRASLVAQMVKNPPIMQETPILGLGRSPGERIGYPLQYSWASLVAQLVKICLQCGRPGFDPWFGKIPWRKEHLPTPVFWPGEFHGLYSLWGHKESDTTERLSLTHLFPIPPL